MSPLQDFNNHWMWVVAWQSRLDSVDAKTLEIKPASDETYSDMLELADELPDSSPRFVLLSYPMTLVCPLHWTFWSGGSCWTLGFSHLGECRYHTFCYIICRRTAIPARGWCTQPQWSWCGVRPRLIAWLRYRAVRICRRSRKSWLAGRSDC